MNAGAHGGETKDVLVEARAIDRSGNLHVIDNAGMGFAYRHCAVPADRIFTHAVFEGRASEPAGIEREMQAVAEYREANQPIKSRTGARPSRIRPATAPGNSSTPPAAGACAWAARICPRCIATS